MVSKDLIGMAWNTLQNSYCKILLINLTDDTYQPVLIDDAEWQAVRENKLSGFHSWFLNTDLLHPDDVFLFKNFWLRADAGEYIHYRRKDGDDWQWVLLELVATKNYTKENKECMLYVSENKITSVDTLTGLLNGIALERDLARYKGGTVGVAFVDLNALKFTNDEKGHEAGDNLIRELANLLKSAFPDYGVYRRSGDEFVVLATNVSLRTFLKRVVAWHRWLWTGQEYPMASVGYSLAEDTVSIYELIEDAETAMYVDKDIFHARYPKFDRK